MVLNYIFIAFENLETILVSRENISSFSFYDIITNYSKGWHDNNVYETHEAKTVMLILEPSADVELDNKCNANTVFERLTKYDDIVSIEMVYADGTRKEVYVDFDGEYSNVNQTHAKLKDGHLIIVVSKTETAEDNRKHFELE